MEQLQKPSEKQQEKILEEILKNKDIFWSSDVGQSLLNDMFNLNKKS